MPLDELKTIVVNALEELKAVDLKVLDVRRIASFTDFMIIASGTSSRHVRALADKVMARCKAAGVRPLGLEGEREAEWILVDLGDIVVHVMSPAMRDYYNLEKLWSAGDQATSSAVV